MKDLAALSVELTQRLAEAEATIEALLSGQIDAVVDARSETPLLLSEAQDALRRERDRAEAYLDTAEVIMLAIDLDGRMTMINRYGRDVLGRTSEELLGRDWFETCVPARMRDALKSRFETFVRSGGSTVTDVIVENPVITKSGEERLIEWRNSVLRDDAGPVTGVLSSGTDITDRTQAVANVIAAEERMRFALESAEVGIWDMDYKTGVLSWSATLERQYGLLPGSFDGTFKTFAALIHPDDRASALEVVSRAAAAGSDFFMHNRVVRPDGTVRSLHGVGRVYHDGNGQPLRGVGISLDVTERRLLEMQYQMASKMDAVGQLASGVAHDFNNLLTVILGFTDFVMEDSALPEHHRRDLGEAIKAARRASMLTKQLLAFSRQQVLETVPLDLNKLITEMTGMLRRLIGEHIEVSLTLAQKLPLTMSDRGQLEQVVMNLLVNARDAMPDGGTVTLATTHVQLSDSSLDDEPVQGGHYVLLSVSDNGTGMSPETRRRLFEPFYTTKETGQGTGLGLSTAYGIVKQSRGYIFVESQLGQGTTFRVYLPCADEAACVAQIETLAARPAVRVSETVLLVEDEAGVREFSRRSLEREGYRVLVAENGDEADRMFDEHAADIDLILTDVVMPGCGGPELAARLRLRKEGLRVLYMSGYTEQSAANVIALSGGPPMLQKPFTTAELRRRVRDVLDRVVHP